MAMTLFSRWIPSKSRLFFGFVTLVVASGMLVPRYRTPLESSPTSFLPVELQKMDGGTDSTLEPSVAEATEIPANFDSSPSTGNSVSSPIKGSWNPSPSWRAGNSWPSNQREIQLRPLTIEQIPESYPLSIRDRSDPPVIVDAVRPSQADQLKSIPQKEILSSTDLPGTASTATALNRESRSFQAAQSPFPTERRVGHLSSTLQSLQSTQPNTNFQPPKAEVEVQGQRERTGRIPPLELSPVDSQRFIRQPKTRR